MEVENVILTSKFPYNMYMLSGAPAIYMQFCFLQSMLILTISRGGLSPDNVPLTRNQASALFTIFYSYAKP